MKWLSILRQLIRDVLVPGLGTWIIWKQSEAPVPNTPLILFAAACFWPTTRSALTTILSVLGSSSPSQEQPSERLPPSSSSPRSGGPDEAG